MTGKRIICIFILSSHHHLPICAQKSERLFAAEAVVGFCVDDKGNDETVKTKHLGENEHKHHDDENLEEKKRIAWGKGDDGMGDGRTRAS